MSRQPQVSVIIPLFNNEENMEECIDSVLNQTLKNIEIICVDAGSTDNTVNILKSYAKKDERVKVFLSYKKTYGGLLNHGISISNGRYITVIKTEDTLNSNMLETLNGLTQRNYIDIIECSRTCSETKTNDAIKKVPIEKAFTINNETSYLEDFNTINGILYKRSFLKHQNIQFTEKNSLDIEEFYFYETALKAATIKYTDKVGYCYKNYNKLEKDNLKNLYDFSKMMIPLFNINRKYNKSNPIITEFLYSLIFDNIKYNLDNYTKSTNNFDYNTCEMLNKLFKYVNKEFVRRKLNTKEKQFYYKFKSPLLLLTFNKEESV